MVEKRRVHQGFPLRLKSGCGLPWLVWLWSPILWFCSHQPDPAPSAIAGKKSNPTGWFLEVSHEMGIDFLHQDGRSGQRYYVETAASGGGWLDFDNDGDLDLYLVNGALTPGSPGRVPPRNALYENQGGHFVNITERAGVGDSGYGMGCCAGDFDGDGLLDLFVTNYGEDRLFHNLGSGRFEEVGARAGVAGARWGTNCAFGDVDGDGDLDLYVANYVAFDFEENPTCGDRVRNQNWYCRPTRFQGQADYLYLNQGDGTFAEEGAQRGIDQGPDEKGFGVLMSDVDFDGDLDLFVANDGAMNRFYRNKGNGFFEDRSLMSGFGFNQDGLGESGMGIDAADVNGDGRWDFWVTNYSFETHTLYLGGEDLFFEDETNAAGIADPSYIPVGWGVAFFDYDNDGDADAAVANGHVMDNIEQFEPGITYPQPNHLFENDGGGVFRDVSALAGEAFQTPKVSRGLAVGDWNNDGRVDLLITNTNGRVDLLENRLINQNHWIGISLRGPTANPFAIGARVVLKYGQRRMMREVRAGSSFLAQADLRLHFGLGRHSGPVLVEIHWPDGRRQIEHLAEIDRYCTLHYQSPNRP